MSPDAESTRWSGGEDHPEAFANTLSNDEDEELLGAPVEKVSLLFSQAYSDCVLVVLTFLLVSSTPTLSHRLARLDTKSRFYRV